MAAREGGGVSLAPVGAAQGAAWRGRQRRLSSLVRFTALSVKVALATSCHHSAGPVPSVVDDVREVAQRVDVLESRIACDMDAVKDDVVARLSSLVNSVSELETTSMLFALFSLLSWLLCSRLLSSLICRFLRWAQICRSASCRFLRSALICSVSESVSATKTVVSGQAEVIRKWMHVFQPFLNSL